jgi:dolichol kinase
VGSQFGQRKWNPLSPSSKTVEGTLAAFTITFIAFIVIFRWSEQPINSSLTLQVLIISFVTAYAETTTVLNDNIVLPIYVIMTIIFLSYATWTNVLFIL